MRFVELIHLRSAATSSLELGCVDEPGSEFMLGQVGRARSAGLACSLCFPLGFGCRAPSGASGLAGKGSAGDRAGLWGRSGPGLCPQVFGWGSGGGTAEQSPLGTLRESQELPCPSVPGGKAVELAPRESSHGWKGARPAGLWVPPTPGAHPGCSPDLVAAPARGEQGKGDPGGKGHERVGGSEWALLNCRCWLGCLQIGGSDTDREQGTGQEGWCEEADRRGLAGGKGDEKHSCRGKREKVSCGAK